MLCFLRVRAACAGAGHGTLLLCDQRGRGHIHPVGGFMTTAPFEDAARSVSQQIAFGNTMLRTHA
jgi:hypothetical protein